MSKMPTESFVQEPTVAIKSLQGDRIEGCVNSRFRESDIAKSSFFVKISMKLEDRPCVVKLACTYVPETRMYAAKASVSDNVAIFDDQILITKTQVERPKEKTDLLNVRLNFSFRVKEYVAIERTKFVEERCSICLDTAPLLLVLPCNHQCICAACTTRLTAKVQRDDMQCPVCRQTAETFFDPNDTGKIKY